MCFTTYWHANDTFGQKAGNRTMKRRVIDINREKCNGCGACAQACHEGAIELVDGKARLVSDEYCDGLGNCLPECPTGAITFVERDAVAFDEGAVRRRQTVLAQVMPRQAQPIPLSMEMPVPSACPGSAQRVLARHDRIVANTDIAPSELSQWPVQIRLVNIHAPYLEGARLLIAADCTAYAHGAFHSEFMRDHVTLIGCPKLDDNQYYAEKLTEIFAAHSIQSIRVVRMEVPCCSGIVAAVKAALLASGKALPYEEIVLGIDGRIQSPSGYQQTTEKPIVSSGTPR
jgi:ferredoxin